ncbi:hypothetical protein BU17DRAFT_100257 [Hysterangium stoloniferum]|nr:hypothetical protein BU17DRAFT_100257 [Hysterangium stoloniferum]
MAICETPPPVSSIASATLTAPPKVATVTISSFTRPVQTSLRFTTISFSRARQTTLKFTTTSFIRTPAQSSSILSSIPVTSSSSLTSLVVRTPSTSPSLKPRQACESTDFSCLCTPATREQVANCAECILTVTPTLLDALQGLINEDVLLCAKSGHPIASVTLTIPAPSMSPQPTTTAVSSSGSFNPTTIVANGTSAGFAIPSAPPGPSTTTVASSGGTANTIMPFWAAVILEGILFSLGWVLRTF